jgi:hypothetical protein
MIYLFTVGQPTTPLMVDGSIFVFPSEHQLLFYISILSAALILILTNEN